MQGRFGFLADKESRLRSIPTYVGQIAWCADMSRPPQVDPHVREADIACFSTFASSSG